MPALHHSQPHLQLVGAWLAERAGKQVIAPGFEMRQGKMWWGFVGLLPSEWIRL